MGKGENNDITMAKDVPVFVFLKMLKFSEALLCEVF